MSFQSPVLFVLACIYYISTCRLVSTGASCFLRMFQMFVYAGITLVLFSDKLTEFERTKTFIGLLFTLTCFDLPNCYVKSVLY